MPSSQEIARVMAEMDRFNQTAKMTVTEERYEKRVASVGGSYGGLTALLQQGAPGNWASDHKSEAEKFAGWHYVAISSIGKAVRSANCEAYQEKVREYAKAYNEQDDDSEPLQKWHPLMKLLKRPNPSQSGASFREEVAIQLCLTGSALIWNVPNQMGRTVERYVIPTAIAEPRQPERGRPKGGWYINPEVARWQIESGWFLYTGLATAIGKVIDARDVQVIRFIHPVFKDEGQSPVSAGALWTDTSEKVDISRHSHLRNGSDPSVIIGIDGVEDEGTLQRMSAKFNEKYAGPSKHGKAMFVNGQNVKVEPVTRTPAEMAYEGAFLQFRDAIMALHGVTPIAAGIEAPSGDDGLYAPLKQFISGTVQPILDLMAEEDTEQLAGQFGEGISVLYTAKAVDDAKLTEQQINTDIAAGAIEVDEIRKIRGRKPWGGEKGKAVAGQGAKEEPKPGLPGLAQGVPGLEPQTGSQTLDPSKPTQGTPDPMKLAEEAVAKALGGFADRLSALLKSGDNCGTGAGGFKPGNDCAGGEGGSSEEEYKDRLFRVGKKIRNREQVSEAELSLLNPDDRAAMERLRSEYKPRSAKPKEELKVVKKYKNGVEVVDGKFSATDEPDEYLYHVTTKERASKIGKDGFVADKARSMGSGFYEEYSKGKVFFADRNGVSYWQGKISDHLESQTDGEAPKLVVLRVPKASVSGLEKDDLGTKDSRAGAYFVRGGVKLKSFFKSSDCGANGPGGGGFQPGNDCARGEGGDKPAKKKRGKKVAEESSGPKIEVFERGAGELEFTSRGDLIRGKLGDLPITEGDTGLIGKLSKKTKAGIEAAMADPDILEDIKAGGIEALNVEATNYYQKKTGRKANWSAAYHDGVLTIHPKTVDTIESSAIQEKKDGGLKRVISHEAGHGVYENARDADKKAFAEALKKNPEIVDYVSRMVSVAANPNAFSDTGSRVVTESFAEIHALRQYNREMYDSLPEDIRNPVEAARKYGLELSEHRVKWRERLKPKWQKSGSDCGANAEGGGGFQPGNTCGRGDGSGESGGENEYRGSHKAPGRDGGAPLDDMTGGGEVYPDDIYSDKAASYYRTGEPAMDRKSIKIIQSLRGKPDAEVTIYRAVPSDVEGGINPGDWVTINRDYAVMHGEGPLRGDYRILELKVRAGDVYSSGDSIHEYGYDPAPKKKSLGKSGSSCGANAQGGGGFQPGNTCGKRDGKGSESSEVGGKGASVNPKILAWARDKFGDDATAENFAKWFGDSKVVDEEGNPLVVYHGTRRSSGGKIGQGGFAVNSVGVVSAFFDMDAERADGYAVSFDESFNERKDGVIIPAFLAIKNPKVFKSEYNFELDAQSIKKAKDEGYDGYSASGRVFLPFSPTQIKSATGNSGTFDPEDPNITKSGSGCGANAEGGGGFQRGNTCGGKKGKKDSASGKKAKKAESSSGEFVPAKTIKEAEQFALDNGLAKKVNYKKLDLELANEVNETLFKLKEKYGLAYDEIETSARKSTIVATNKADFTGGQYKGTTLKINATGFAAKAKELSYFVNKNISDQSMHIKDSDSTSEVLKKLAHHNANETVGGGSIKATIAHEYGHLLTIPTESLDVAIRQQRLLKNLGDSSISKYAGTNGDERLAEIFALHYIDPEKVEQRHKDFFNKFSKVKI